jgi:hypothetical protein
MVDLTTFRAKAGMFWLKYWLFLGGSVDLQHHSTGKAAVFRAFQIAKKMEYFTSNCSLWISSPRGKRRMRPPCIDRLGSRPEMAS